MGTAKNLNVALDGVVQWGRWADGKLAGNDGFSVNALQGFHYAIGALSASLPVSGTKTTSWWARRRSPAAMEASPSVPRLRPRHSVRRPPFDGDGGSPTSLSSVVVLKKLHHKLGPRPFCEQVSSRARGPRR